MAIRPLIESVAATEGGGGTKRSDGSDNGGASGSGDSQVMVCIELATGSLQRNITLIAMTIESPTSTGKYSGTSDKRHSI